MCAVVVNAADVLRCQEKRVACLSHGDIKASAKNLIAFAGLFQLLLHVAPNLVGQLDAARIIPQRIAAEIEAVHKWVHVERSSTNAGIFSGVVSQGRFRSPRSDFLKQRQFFFRSRSSDWFIGIFDGPVVVRAKGSLVVLPLLGALRSNVRGNVVHHRTRQALPRCERRVVGLLLDLNRLSKANSLERFVPKQDTFTNGVAVFQGNRVIEPENDGLLGTREFSRTFLLFQPPAVDIAAAGFKVGVGAVVLNLGEEMADAVVSKPGTETRRRQLGEAVTEMN